MISVDTRYGCREAARMEWIKLRSLRSTRWVLAAGMVATVALGVVAGYNTRSVTGGAGTAWYSALAPVSSRNAASSDGAPRDI